MAQNVQHHPTRHASFWGECTATLDWCEENYHHTPFIAEFWNTISNLGYIVMGWWGAKQCWALRQALPFRYALLFVWMAVIGVGSLLFHATLKYSMQLLDEIPMLFSNSQILYCLWHPSVGLKFPERFLPLWFRSSPVGYFAFSIMITAMYVCIPSCTVFFQICYGAMILLMAVSLHLYACQLELQFTKQGARSVRKLLDRSAIFMLAAFALWNVDNIWCDRLRSLRHRLPFIMGPFLQLHAWWHILTMISGVHTICAVLVAWCKCNAEKHSITWQLFATCNGMLPWISMTQNSKKSKKNQ